MWLKTPPPNVETGTIPLLRAKPGGSVTATLTGEPLRCFVHFAVGRSWPCTNWQCGLCSKGIGRRCYAYYPVEGKHGQRGILELTAQVESSLIKQMSPNTKSPCGQILLTRPAGRRNQQCIIKWEGLEEHLQTGGEPLTENELKDALMRIWNLPRRNGKMSELEYLEQLNEAIRLRTNNRKT